ncbi:hypothetical protein ABK040_005996 [Willaertia magna]
MLKSSGFFTDQDKANAANAFEYATKSLVEKKAKENIKKEEDKLKPKHTKRDIYIKDTTTLGDEQPREKVENKEDEDFDYLLEEEDDELAKLKEMRLEQLKKQNSKKLELVAQRSHTKYTEIGEEQFLDTVLKSKYCVCHFYHRDFERCKIVDKHLSLLCEKYWQTRFCKLNAEKSSFFVGKLQVKMLPSIVLFKHGVAVDRIVGFDELGGRDDFPTKAMELRLLSSKVVGMDLPLD